MLPGRPPTPEVGTPSTAGDDLCLEDLRWVLTGALEVAGALLTAGERAYVAQVLALEGPPARLLARLASRRGEVFRAEDLHYAGVPDVHAAVDALIAADLAHEHLPPRLRAEVLTVPELREVCAALGLPRGGRREALLARVATAGRWRRGRVFRVSGSALLRRLEVLWFRDPWRDRSARVLERLGQARWVPYVPGGGGRPFAARADWLGFLAVLAGEDAAPEQLLARVQAQAPRPQAWRRLDPRRVRVRRLVEAARGLERAGEAARAADLYAGLLSAGLRHPGPVALRLAMALGAAGRPEEGARACLAWRDRVEPPDRPALERTGRRLARAAGLTWVPAPPLRRPPERRLRLPRRAGEGPRPLWGDEGLHVEAAVRRLLGARASLHGENPIWTTLFGLVMLDLYWLPVPDMLPAPFLDGPLDLGTPGFAAARAAAVEARLDAVRRGEAAERVLAHHARYAGARVAGVDWGLAPVERLVEVVEGMGGEGLAAVFTRLLAEGWSAARGLPDLVVLPGEPLRLPAAHPARVPGGLLLVEVKGEGDQLSDAQRVWMHHLLGAGLAVELWHVEAA